MVVGADVSAENVVHGTEHKTMSRHMALWTNAQRQECHPRNKVGKISNTSHPRGKRVKAYMPINSWSSKQVGSLDARALVGAFLSVGVDELRSGLLLCPQNDQRYQSIKRLDGCRCRCVGKQNQRHVGWKMAADAQSLQRGSSDAQSHVGAFHPVDVQVFRVRRFACSGLARIMAAVSTRIATRS